MSDSARIAAIWRLNSKLRSDQPSNFAADLLPKFEHLLSEKSKQGLNNITSTVLVSEVVGNERVFWEVKYFGISTSDISIEGINKAGETMCTMINKLHESFGNAGTLTPLCGILLRSYLPNLQNPQECIETDPEVKYAICTFFAVRASNEEVNECLKSIGCEDLLLKEGEAPRRTIRKAHEDQEKAQQENQGQAQASSTGGEKETGQS